MMSQEQASNLLNVATALRESLKPAKFTMGCFANFDWDKYYKEMQGKNDPKVINECGTPACSLGHYAAREDLQNTFTLNYKSDAVFSKNSKRSVNLTGSVVCKEFGINPRTAEAIFGPMGCGNATTTFQAAVYIENFLERKGWVPA